MVLEKERPAYKQANKNNLVGLLHDKDPLK